MYAVILCVIFLFRCKSCSHVTTTDDIEDWVYHQLEDTTHLLHGVIHSNGYGHLLRVNGREGGSRVLSGCHITDFWDRLCKTLAVRSESWCLFPYKFDPICPRMTTLVLQIVFFNLLLTLFSLHFV